MSIFTLRGVWWTVFGGGGVLLFFSSCAVFEFVCAISDWFVEFEGMAKVELEVVITMRNKFQTSTSSKSILHSEYGRYSGVANIFLQFLGGEERETIL